MKTIYIATIAAAVFATGAFAQSARAVSTAPSGVGGGVVVVDSASSRQQTAASVASAATPASLNKQGSVRPQTTKRTNWSKIKMLFE